MFATKKRRAIPVLKSLTYHIDKRLDTFSLKTLADVLFALNQLTFNNHVSFVRLVKPLSIKT